MKNQYSKLLIALLFLLVNSCSDPLPPPKDYNITLYAATYAEGIYETKNGGKSWYPLEIDQNEIHYFFKRIYLSPSNKDLIYVITTGGGLFQLNLLQSTLEKRGSFSDENINSIAFLKTTRKRQYDLMLMGFSNLGIMKTLSDYEVWQSFNQGLSYLDVNVVFNVRGNLYAGTAKDLYKLDKTSQNWISISNSIQNKCIYSIGGDQEGKALYAGAGPYGDKKGYFDKFPCLYKSTDEGTTWTPSDKGIPDETLIYTITVNPQDSKRIYLGTSEGLYRSIDGGNSWKKPKQGLPKNFRVLDIKIAKMKDGTDVVYAVGNKGVFMTVDDDKTKWVSKNYNLPQTMITSIIMVPEGQSEK